MVEILSALIKSENAPNDAKNCSSNDAGGLHQNTIASKGCRVYLQSNLWASAGMFLIAFSIN